MSIEKISKLFNTTDKLLQDTKEFIENLNNTTLDIPLFGDMRTASDMYTYARQYILEANKLTKQINFLMLTLSALRQVRYVKPSQEISFDFLKTASSKIDAYIYEINSYKEILLSYRTDYENAYKLMNSMIFTIPKGL
jgi:hypothetical protein